MISDNQSPRKRDITSPRRDVNTRISKPVRKTGLESNSNRAKYSTEEEQSRQFVADEDRFVLSQSKKKADIRVREGRAKPIDYLAYQLRFIDTDRDTFVDDDNDIKVDAPAPTKVIDGLGPAQLKDLSSDISSYLVLETNSRNREYWRALETLCKDILATSNAPGYERRVVNSVAEDINKILAPKTHEQLSALEKQIKVKLRSDEDIDTDYWEQLLSSLLVWKSKAILKRIQDEVQQNQLKVTQRSANAQALNASTETITTDSSRRQNGQVVASSGATGLASQAVASTGSEKTLVTGNEDFSQLTNALYDREAARGILENEEIFMAEEAVPDGSNVLSRDGHKTRKPRYFNRVQMGYEWNKYNQTHYDHDNPPPKVVQGYKFNIFYPELIDKTKAPTFKIVREHGRKRGESFAAAGEEDTCLIRFIAGPPYEDIAFRIVDHEWDYSAKRERGYRSSFDKVRFTHSRFRSRYYIVREGILETFFPWSRV